MTGAEGSLYSSHACSPAYTWKAQESKKCICPFLQTHCGWLARPQGKGQLAGQVSST